MFKSYDVDGSIRKCLSNDRLDLQSALMYDSLMVFSYGVNTFVSNISYFWIWCFSVELFLTSHRNRDELVKITILLLLILIIINLLCIPVIGNEGNGDELPRGLGRKPHCVLQWRTGPIIIIPTTIINTSTPESSSSN